MNNQNDKKIIDLIKRESSKIYPDKKIFSQIMAKIPKSVTNESKPRYSFMEEVLGRGSFLKINNLIKIFNPMAMKWKIIAPVGVVAIIALVLIGANQFGTKSPQAPIADNAQNQEQSIAISQDLPVATSKPATGDIDETVNTILAAAFEEEAFFADAIKDAELITADNQSINNFAQSYYENEF